MKYLFDMYLDKIVDVILRIYTVCVCVMERHGESVRVVR